MNKIVLFLIKITSLILLIAGGVGFIIGARILNSSASVFKSTSANKSTLNIISQLKNTASGEQTADLLKGQAEGRTNILLLGKGGKGHPGGELTDAIMVLSIKYNQLTAPEAALISIPRDLYTPISGTKYYTRINAIKAYGSNYLGPKKILKDASPEEADEFKYQKEIAGMNFLKKTMEETFGLPVHYYVELDFEGFTDIIDLLGGVTYTVKEDINDPLYPGPNYSYDPFYIKKGEYLLDGKTVLKLMRSRHSTQGDFNRIERQQELLKLIKEKAITGNPVRDLFLFSKVSENLEKHMFTDMGISDFKMFWEIGKNIDPQKAAYMTIDKDNGFLKGEIINGAQILVPKSGSYDDIQGMIYYIFDAEEQNKITERMKKNDPTLQRKEDVPDNSAENPTITLILKRQKNSFSEKIISSLEEKGFEIVKVSEPDNTLSIMQNILYDNSIGQKPLSLKYLEKTFSVKAIKPKIKTITDSDFTLIVNN